MPKQVFCPYCKENIKPIRVKRPETLFLRGSFKYLQCPNCKTVAIAGMFEWAGERGGK
jgi:phage FluMu protein Com